MASSATVAPLVVVVVHKDHRVCWVRHSPALVVDSCQTSKIVAVDEVRHLQTVTEFCNTTDTKVLLDLDRFTPLVNHLVDEERPSSLREIWHPVYGALDVSGPHVLCGVDPEPHHSHVDAVLQIPSNLLLDVTRTTVKVIQADQIAVANLGWVAIVADGADGLVEVIG